MDTSTWLGSPSPPCRIDTTSVPGSGTAELSPTPFTPVPLPLTAARSAPPPTAARASFVTSESAAGPAHVTVQNTVPDKQAGRRCQKRALRGLGDHARSRRPAAAAPVCQRCHAARRSASAQERARCQSAPWWPGSPDPEVSLLLEGWSESGLQWCTLGCVAFPEPVSDVGWQCPALPPLPARSQMRVATRGS
eukprot:355979-Chlamydomonas_euryale.AAC.5